MTAKEFYNFIEDVASELRAKMNEINNFDGDVSKLLKDTVNLLGGKIQAVRNDVPYEESGGSLEIEKTGKFTINLPSNTSPLNDNFTIAHELGHYVLHYQEGDEKKVYARYGKNMVEEYQANRFAAAFLMPKNQFIEAKKEFKGSPLLLAAKFQVPIEIVMERMEYIK